jgi:uncharacterized protein YxjI
VMCRSPRPANVVPTPERSNAMGLRNRREERGDDRREERQAFGRRGSASRFQMRQKMISIGDDYWIEDESGEKIYRVDGKALRVRSTLDLEDAHGTTLCRIQARVLNIRDTMEIEDPDGNRLAVVRKALVSPLRERWKVDREGGEDWTVQGNIVDHEYEIEADGRKIAEISKKWFRVRDTYGVEVAPDLEPVLILAVTVAVDAMAHPRD